MSRSQLRIMRPNEPLRVALVLGPPCSSSSSFNRTVVRDPCRTPPPLPLPPHNSSRWVHPRRARGDDAWRPAAAAMDQERFEVRPLIVGHQSAMSLPT